MILLFIQIYRIRHISLVLLFQWPVKPSKTAWDWKTTFTSIHKSKKNKETNKTRRDQRTSSIWKGKIIHEQKQKLWRLSIWWSETTTIKAVAVAVDVTVYSLKQINSHNKTYPDANLRKERNFEPGGQHINFNCNCCAAYTVYTIWL